MIGRRRLDNLEHCVLSVIHDRVPGDLIEAGVWRGGAAMVMQAILAAHRVRDRTLFLADSFAGVPAPSPERFPSDADFTLHLDTDLAVSLEEVRANFVAFGLLDDRVRFVKGWFRDTLPALRSHQWSLVRLDGDLYESTYDGLSCLYDGLSPGGYVIIDDFGVYPACAAAVHDFRTERSIDETIHDIDGEGAFWRKSLSR